MKSNPTATDSLKEKLSLIDDIFRVTRLSIQINPQNEAKITTGAGVFFDSLMHLTNEALEVKLAQLSAKLSLYMKAKHRAQIKDLRIITSDFRYPDNFFSKINYN